jgi:predicted phage-related endonuclease
MSYLSFNEEEKVEKIKAILKELSITDYSIQKYDENCEIEYEEKYKNGVLDLQDMNIKLHSLQNKNRQLENNLNNQSKQLKYKIEQLENKNKNSHLNTIKEINANRRTLNNMSIDARKYRKNYGILKQMRY